MEIGAIRSRLAQHAERAHEPSPSVRPPVNDQADQPADVRRRNLGHGAGAAGEPTGIRGTGVSPQRDAGEPSAIHQPTERPGSGRPARIAPRDDHLD
jgi:hypothetical protein